jgi:cardiolipin synthase
MKLLVQPGDGIAAILKAIEGAKLRVDIMIFRFDRKEIERALAAAVARGVEVRALVANVNRAGEANLRKLEMRLLAAGVTVARTAGELLRYHAKMMIIDRRELHVFAFNYTVLDIEHSRSFGLITTNRPAVLEAERLFEADFKRHKYEPETSSLVVSPVNARKTLAAFLSGAKRELMIYDPNVSDSQMLDILEQKSKAGVNIRIIGQLGRKAGDLSAYKLHELRLHTRTIVRDGRAAFIGSQSLREAELDLRREVGLIFKEPKTVAKVAHVFEQDWERAKANGPQPSRSKVAKKFAKAVASELPPMTPMLEQIIQEMGEKMGVESSMVDIERVEAAAKEAVKEAVKVIVKEAVDQQVPEGTATK